MCNAGVFVPSQLARMSTVVDGDVSALAETAESAQRETEGSASGSVSVDYDTAACNVLEH